MKTIYRYELPNPLPHNSSSLHLRTRGKFKPLSVGQEDGKLVIWGEIEVPKDEYDSDNWVYAYVDVQGTGSNLPATRGPFIGSIQTPDGYVWHVYCG